MKRGRPKKLTNQTQPLIDIKLVKMENKTFNPDLFKPLKTNTIVDSILSTEGGIFPGTNTIVIGEPGVGKSTVLLDWLANVQKSGKKVLFLSGEMNEIDLYGYVNRFPKFGKIPIMFLGDYSDKPKQAIEQVLKQGYDVILIDSWAEVTAMVKEQMNWMRGKVESWLLDLMEYNNKGNNDLNKNTAFICIQQMTKAGEFAGSNRIKHMTTSMACIRYDRESGSGDRFIVFSKNRRGDTGTKIYFDMNKGENIDYNFELIN